MSSNKITVSFGGAHQARITKVEQLSWGKFCNMIEQPPPEATDKAERGWYCPSEFVPQYRHSDNFVARHAITFDFDAVNADTWDKLEYVWNPIEFIAYTTYSHTPEKPRFRVVTPLSRPATYDEYQALVRKVAESIGIELVARESFVPAQFMYLPTVRVGCSSEYLVKRNPGLPINVDDVLAEYDDWTDKSQWPHRKDGDGVHAASSEMTPPTEKPGIIGAFCRAFDVPAAIERFDLPYKPTNVEGRWTYIGGSRPEGAIVYDNGQKLHSHHDTDPARGQHNSFDLVRLHLFGGQDAVLVDRQHVSVVDLPSYHAMSKLASSQPELQTAIAESEFEDLGPEVREELIVSTDGKTDRFRVIPAEEFTAGAKLRWIIKGILPRAELCVVYGESGSGKSFLATDFCAAITRGINWRENKTEKGSVVYVCAEGTGGYKTRLRAYAQEHNCALRELPAVIPDAPNLLEAKDVAALTKSILEWGNPDVVVIDTLSATTPGSNENSGEDMGRVIAHCKFIHRKTGALVVLIHHSGKDASRGARGWSGLRAAADAEIEVVRNGDFRSASVTKLKDGEDGGEIPFRLRTVSLPVEPGEDPESSCVIEHSAGEQSSAGPRAKPTGAHQILVYDTLRTMSAGFGSVALEDLMLGVVAKTARPEGRDFRRRNSERALDSLIAKRLAFMQGEDRVSLSTAVEADNSWLD